MIQLAIIDHSNGEIEKSKRKVKNHIDSNVGNIAVINQAIIFYSYWDMMDISQKIFNDVLKYFYTDLNIYSAMAIANLNTNNLEKSIDYFNLAVTISERSNSLSENSSLVLNRAIAQYLNGNISAALVDYIRYSEIASREDLLINK